MGCGDARNTGLMLAKGKYIVFVDSDDFIKCNMIKKLYSNMLKSDLDLLMFEAKVIYSGIKSKYSNVKKSRYIKKYKYLEIQSGIDLFTKMRKNSEFSSVVWIMMYKKELLDRYNIQFISQVLHEDIFFTFQCLFLARKVLFIPKKYYFRRIRENSIMTRRYNINNSYSCYISADALEDFCNKYKFYDSCDEVCRFINDVRFQYIDDVLMLDKNQFLIETKKYKVPNDYLNFVDEYGKKNL